MSMKQYVEHCFVTEKTIIGRICDALHDLVQFVQFKNIHVGMLQGLQLYEN